jgi:glycine/D-amino acid oxidase-like deaminating enzyme/nitrite reductase/ring-hydroxylating ferredoxin subunit
MSLKDRNDSLWEKISLLRAERLKKNIETPICIVGAGITGLSCAYQLAKRGHRVTIVESFKVGSGQTSRTTAHLSNIPELPIQELVRYLDCRDLQAYMDAETRAIEEISSIVSLEGISCDFQTLDGYFFQGTNVGKEFLDKEVRAARQCGIEMEMIPEVPLLKDKRAGILYRNQGQFHPLKYLQGLLRVLKELNVQIFEETQITEFQEEGKSVLLRTDAGLEINAKKVIVATDSPVNHLFSIHTKQFAYRTYAISLKCPSSPEKPILLSDTESPYHYVRFFENQMIVGGEDHRVGHEPEHDPFKALERWARENFEGLGEVSYTWSGQIFEPADKLPYIGASPGQKNVFIATGFSGQGITNGTIASLLLTDLIEKKTHPWEKLFDPSRVAVTSRLGESLKESFTSALNYADYLKPGEVENIEDVPLDHGCLMQKGLTKACVYHTAQDGFEVRTAICTHLGGIVHWNDIEKTWDCPAHGSRFNTKGKVIEGPAISELKDQ